LAKHLLLYKHSVAVEFFEVNLSNTLVVLRAFILFIY